MKFQKFDYGPLPAGVSENDMMIKIGRPDDHPVSIEHARRRKIDQERRAKSKAEKPVGVDPGYDIDPGFGAGGSFKGINTGGLKDIGMIPAPSPINTAGPIKYNPTMNGKGPIRQGPAIMGGMDLSSFAPTARGGEALIHTVPS